MVTEDSKILLHRFNWQRLWTISPGENTSALNYVLQLKVYSVKQDYSFIQFFFSSGNN